LGWRSLLVSARGGNIPTALWIDDRRFTIHALYADYADIACDLPEHRLVMNAIGDADLCGEALERAERLLARTTGPVINPPARVRATGRADNARRLAGIAGVIVPRIERISRRELDRLRYPVLLRSPGFHTGRHFVHVQSRAAAGEAAAALAGEELLAIEYLDARGADGMARKYRVMFIDGRIYPLHLAISTDWKVHYFSADMARSADFREEERRFLCDMPGVLGPRAMEALTRVAAALDLQYAGADFALARDGSVLLFEANATMVVFPPGPDPLWDYRRAAIETALDEVRSALGPIAIMVTSAGIEGFTDFLDITPESWDRMMAVNLTGTFHCLQAAVPDMIDAGWGRIVTISSSSAQSGTRRMSHYVASKGGVIAFTKALALDLAPKGITVNTIPPGVIDTPMMRRPIDAGTMNVDAVIARAPLGRLGTPEDIAAACVFLCSEEAGYITGQQINVNGGWYL